MQGPGLLFSNLKGQSFFSDQQVAFLNSVKGVSFPLRGSVFSPDSLTFVCASTSECPSPPRVSVKRFVTEIRAGGASRVCRPNVLPSQALQLRGDTPEWESTPSAI